MAPPLSSPLRRVSFKLTASTAITYTFNLQIGVDAQGFYLNTANDASSLSVGFTTTIPGLDASAMLSQLKFRITDQSGTDGDSVAPTMFGGSFAVDLLDPSGADNGRLRIFVGPSVSPPVATIRVERGTACKISPNVASKGV